MSSHACAEPDLRFVSGDHGHATEVTLVDQDTGAPVNVSGVTVRLYLWQVGSPQLTATLTGTLPGTGADGRVRFVWPPGALDAPGDYLGEIEASAPGLTQTAYRTLRAHVRAQLI